MTMSIGRKVMYGLMGMAAGGLMIASLGSCNKGKTESTPENTDSVLIQSRLHNKGIYDPSISYAQAKIKLDSVLRAEYPEAKSFEEAIEKDDSATLAKNCEYLGVPVPKKPDANATEEEKDTYNLQESYLNNKALNRQAKEILNSMIQYLKNN